MENSGSLSPAGKLAAETRVIAETMLELQSLVTGKPPPVQRPVATSASATPRLPQPPKIIVHDSLPPVAPTYSSAKLKSTSPSAFKKPKTPKPKTPKPKTPKMGVKAPRAKPAPTGPVAQVYPPGSIFYPSMDDYFALEARLRAAEARNIRLRNFMNVLFGNHQEQQHYFEPPNHLM